VIASDSEAIQTKPQLGTPSLDCFALLAMTDRATTAATRPHPNPSRRSAAPPRG
jgi:hypothetical protein